MPDARLLLDRGVRLERGGVLDGALRAYVEAAAEAATDPACRSEALRRQADIHRIRCEWEDAVARAQDAADVARDAGLPEQAGEALNALAAIEQSRGGLDRAASLYGQVMDVTRDPRIRGCALQNLGAIAAMRDDQNAATRYFEGSLDCFREAGYARGVAIALNNLGRASLDRGDPARAEEVLPDAVGQARQIEDLELASVALVNLAEALSMRGEWARAEEEVSAALGFFKVSGNRWRQIECLRLLGDIRDGRGEADVARRLYGQAAAIADEIGAEREGALVRGRMEALETRARNGDPSPSA